MRTQITHLLILIGMGLVSACGGTPVVELPTATPGATATRTPLPTHTPLPTTTPIAFENPLDEAELAVTYFFTALQGHDYEWMFDLLARELLKDLANEPDDLAEVFPPSMQVANWRVDDSEFVPLESGEEAILVTGVMQQRDGEAFDMEILVIEQDGVFVVAGFNFVPREPEV